VAILVTGAAGLVGRAAVAALLRQGVEHVRAVVRDPAQVAGLRRLGAKVALLDATDPDGLAAAMDGVFTACSLTGGLWSRPGADPYAAVVEPAEVFLAAATAAGVRRVVVCSPAAVATPAAGNPHLAAKAEVERMIAASGLEHAILRCTHALGPGGRLPELLAAGEPVPVPGDGRQRVAPVWVGDVATAIAAADDAVELTATWSLSGPTELTFDALVDAAHGVPVVKHHLGGVDGGSGAGSNPGTRPRLTPAQLGVLAADSLPDPGLERLPGLVPTPLAEALARSRPARLGAGPGPARAEAPGSAVRGLPGRVDG
jgi:NAD(P)H dehydrogenase (quinone)